MFKCGRSVFRHRRAPPLQLKYHHEDLHAGGHTCEAQCLSLQPCLERKIVHNTCGLENSTLSSSRWMLTVLARVCYGLSGVQVPWPHLSTNGESRPLDSTLKGLVRPSSSLKTSESNPRTRSSPWGFNSEDEGTSRGIIPPSMTPCCESLRCPQNEITTRTR
jgi:hypothetical protein